MPGTGRQQLQDITACSSEECQSPVLSHGDAENSGLRIYNLAKSMSCPVRDDLSETPKKTSCAMRCAMRC